MSAVTVIVLLLMACNREHQQVMPMQQTMDSVKMWYSQMNGDSMETACQRIGAFLQQHKDDHTGPVRRLRAEWLKVRGVWFTAIKGQPDSGLVYTEQALKEMEGLDNVEELRILALANRADFYRQIGKLDRSADGYLQALEAADAAELGDQYKVALMLGISTVYTFMGDYDNSSQWWQRTSRLLPEMKRGDQFIYYNNVGNDHYFQHRYREACDAFKQAAKLVDGDDSKKWDYYTAIGNLGEIFVCLGQADSARIMVERADSFFSKVDFPPLIYYMNTTKMKLHMLEGHTAEALHMAASLANDEVTIPAARLLRLEALRQLMGSVGNWKQAYDFHQQWLQLADSIQTANMRMQMNAKILSYEHDKRLLEQQRDIDRQQLTSRLLWALLVVALLTVVVLVVLMKLRQRRQHLQNLTTRQQILSLRMRNIRNRITPHFIYNALNHEMLEQMEGRTVNFNALTQLLRFGVEQADQLQTTLADELRFVDYFVEIEGRQIAAHLDYRKEIASEVDTVSVLLPAMTIQIFAENAIKHGLRRQGGVLTIRATKDDGKTLVEVIDNGCGLQQGKPQQEHTGMRVVRQTIQMLNEHNTNQISFGIGNWQHEEQSGCRAWVLLPDEYNYQFD